MLSTLKLKRGCLSSHGRIKSSLGFRYLVPFDGGSISEHWKDALWDKFFMAWPSPEQYKIVKGA